MLGTAERGDVIVISGSSVLDTWVSDVVRDACARIEPPVEIATADRGSEPEDAGRSGGPHRALMVFHPGSPIMELIEGGTVPVLAVLDDPVDSVRFMRQAQGHDLLIALRLQTSHACANHLMLDNPAVVLIHRGFSGPAHEVVTAILDHLGLALPAHQLQALLETHGGPLAEPWRLEAALEQRVPGYMRLNHLADVVNSDDATLVRQTLSPLVLGAISGDIGILSWPAKVFLFGDRPNEVAPAVADVTGAARIIYYGPYLHLPPGLWQVRLIVAFSLEAAGTQFRLIFWCNQKMIANVVIKPHEGGAFEGNFTMRHYAPEHNVELHFMNDEGTIAGHMALGQVTFTRLPE